MNRYLFFMALTTLLFESAVAQEAFMEEVVVTAQKRAQNLQDAPVSVTAFTGDTLDKLGIRQSVDITAQTPNFSVGYPAGETGIPALFLRGVGMSDFRVFTPSAIAVYSDEVYVASTSAQIFQLLDLERVEVLRGPQGTLYGRNATGGAVNYIARTPTEEWEGWARAEVGEYGYTKISGAFGGALSDDLRVRISALKTDSDGWLKNRYTGNDQQGIDELAIRALVEWDVTDTATLLLNMRTGETESDSVQYRHRGLLDAGGAPCALAAIQAGQCFDAFGYSEYAPFTDIFGNTVSDVSDFDEGAFDLEAKNDISFWGVSAKLDIELDNEMVFSSITAYDDMDNLRPEETDVSPLDMLVVNLGVFQETFAQEFRLTQQRDGWNWIAGAYYLADEAKDRFDVEVLPFLRPVFVGVDDPGVCGDGTGIVPPPGNPTGFCPGQFVFTRAGRTEQQITSYSVYADASIELTDTLTANVGLRYTDEKVEQDVLQIYLEPAAGNPVRLADSHSETFDAVSGRVVLDWHLTDSVMAYGGISTGFKAGGIDSTVDGIVPFDSEELISYEVGFKSILADGRVRLNAAFFYYDYSDLQVFTFITMGMQVFSVLSNASDADIWGAELELQWVPTANTFISLGMGYLDAEYVDFLDVITGDDFSGNHVVMAPELTFNGVIQQDFPLGDNGTITAQVDFNFQDEVFFDPQNNPLLSEDSYWLYNARVSWTSADDQWEVAVWGRNLGDKEYMVYGFDTSALGFNQEMIGIPRTVGAEATYRF